MRLLFRNGHLLSRAAASSALPARLLPQLKQVQALYLFTRPRCFAQEFQTRADARVVRKATDGNLAGQLFPTVVRFESAHHRLERYPMKGVARLVGGSRWIIHTYLAPSLAQPSQGLMTVTPAASKGPVSREATAKLLASATAAMKASAVSIAKPAARDLASSSA